jgi:glycosyltransferase involved in cell wall biosynthesis
MQYSVVIPVHNEQTAIGELLREIKLVMDQLSAEYEIIVVNDGSKDESANVLKNMQHELDFRLRVLASVDPQGQSAALLSGLRASRGQILITMDGDGQNNPSDIPRLLAMLNDWDMVVGVRNIRRDKWRKRVFSTFANRLRNWTTHSNVPDSGCGLKVFRRACVNAQLPFHGFHRFMTVLVELYGMRVGWIPVDHRSRHGGRSHYGILDRLLLSLLDGLSIAWLNLRRVKKLQVHVEASCPRSEEAFR